MSNRTEMLYASGLRVGRGYDPLDRVVTVGPESATPGVFDSSAAFEYRGPYLQAGKQLSNGVDLVRQFDPARRMVEDSAHNANDWLVYQERLGWSPRNLKTHQVRLDRTLSASTFGYDGASRVTIRSSDAVPSMPPNNVAAGSGSFQTVRDGEAYGLDSAQNLVTRQSVRDGLAGPVVPLTPDSSGRNRPGTLDGVPLTYDANGNLLTKGGLRFGSNHCAPFRPRHVFGVMGDEDSRSAATPGCVTTAPAVWPRRPGLRLPHSSPSFTGGAVPRPP